MPDLAEVLKISHESDRIWCASRCMRFAAEAGFAEPALSQIGIAVSELVTNVLKFAGTGTLSLRRIAEPRPGIEVTVEDNGPGIADIEASLIDGYSEGRFLSPDDPITARRGIGAGLGAVKRLIDVVSITNKPTGGVKVTIRKWRR